MASSVVNILVFLVAEVHVLSFVRLFSTVRFQMSPLCVSWYSWWLGPRVILWGAVWVQAEVYKSSANQRHTIFHIPTSVSYHGVFCQNKFLTPLGILNSFIHKSQTMCLHLFRDTIFTRPPLKYTGQNVNELALGWRRQMGPQMVVLGPWMAL